MTKLDIIESAGKCRTTNRPFLAKSDQKKKTKKIKCLILNKLCFPPPYKYEKKTKSLVFSPFHPYSKELPCFTFLRTNISQILTMKFWKKCFEAT